MANTPKRYIPKSKYKKPKSTSGGDFIELESKKPYKGFYIETYKGKFYAGKRPEENGLELQKLPKKSLGLPLGLLALFRGFFKKKPTQSEIDKGIMKRYFIQDKNNYKVQETDSDTYQQAKEVLVNSTFAEIDWILKGPAEDTIFGNYKYEGATSKNRKAIKALEKVMPGISTFVTNYTYLVEEPVVAAQQQEKTSETFIERDVDIQLDNDRKANFDTRK